MSCLSNGAATVIKFTQDSSALMYRTLALSRSSTNTDEISLEHCCRPSNRPSIATNGIESVACNPLVPKELECIHPCTDPRSFTFLTVHPLFHCGRLLIVVIKPLEIDPFVAFYLPVHYALLASSNATHKLSQQKWGTVVSNRFDQSVLPEASVCRGPRWKQAHNV